MAPGGVHKPFFEFNILDFKERDVEELKKFAKSSFDLDTILTTASDLKYTRAIQNRLAGWVSLPPDDFVRSVSADLIGDRRFTPAVKEQFTAITKRASEQLIGERINDRLKGAMTLESAPAQEKNLLVLQQEESSFGMQRVTAPYCLTITTGSPFADFASTTCDVRLDFSTRAKKM